MTLDYLALAPELVERPRFSACFRPLPAVATQILGGDDGGGGDGAGGGPPILLAGTGLTRSMFDGSYARQLRRRSRDSSIVGAYLVMLMSVSDIESDRYYQGEYYLLLLSSLLGSMVMASGRDLIVLFIGLEVDNGPAVPSGRWRKGDVRSNEASLKYFILGVLSTAMMLYGMSLIFGMTGAVGFEEIALALAYMAGEPVMIMAVIFLLVGFGFKGVGSFRFFSSEV